jgi:UDP-N-acetylglucosamine diphosphorylase/glucosamine-1-phosphate N-acetyltransferase
MNIVFFDDEKRVNFLPLAYTRPIAKFRVGILTIEEKWERYFKNEALDYSISYSTENYLLDKFKSDEQLENWFINSRYFPTKELVNYIVNTLKSSQGLYIGEDLVAAKLSDDYDGEKYEQINWEGESPIFLELVTDIFSKNGLAIEEDYQLITNGRKSATISSTNTIIGGNVFIEEGAKVEASVLSSTNGPIYVGKDAEIMEGSLVRGPFAMCESSGLKMGAKVYGPTTIGRVSKVGGEVNNCVIQDYSSKGHDGFLGTSVIGEWCNLGADTNTSNLKNNYGEVKLWSYKSEELANTGLQFCGLIMGDHAKCGINTMFNTGTVVGVSANVFGSGFPAKFIPSYSWGGAEGFSEYKLDKMFEVAEKVMERRSVELSNEDEAILTAIFDETAKFRK